MKFKLIKRLLLTAIPIISGILIKILSSIYEHNYEINDFMQGFYDGLGISLIAVGLILFGYNIVLFYKSKEH